MQRGRWRKPLLLQYVEERLRRYDVDPAKVEDAWLLGRRKPRAVILLVNSGPQARRIRIDVSALGKGP